MYFEQINDDDYYYYLVNTVLCSFNTMQPSSLNIVLHKKRTRSISKALALGFSVNSRKRARGSSAFS